MVLSHTRHQQGKYQPQHTPLCFNAAVRELLQPWEETSSLNPVLQRCPGILISISESSLLPLHSTNNFFFVFLLRKYNFFIPFLYTHSIPQLSFQAQRRWTKMRSESDYNFNSWHIFGQMLVQFPFPLPQLLLARNRDSHKNTDIDIKKKFLDCIDKFSNHHLTN